MAEPASSPLPPAPCWILRAADGTHEVAVQGPTLIEAK
jgi:hypothetical protein